MQERERRLFRIECLQRQVQHDRAVLADGIQHDRVLTFRSHFPDDIDRFRLELVEVRQVCHGYNSFTSGYCNVKCIPFMITYMTVEYQRKHPFYRAPRSGTLIEKNCKNRRTEESPMRTIYLHVGYHKTA